MLTNRKSKSEVLNELCEFIGKDKATGFIAWLYEEIESIKSERRVQKTPPKKESPKKEIPKKVKKQKSPRTKPSKKVLLAFPY